MAIKGKSRSRGPKAVTRGPKPVYRPVRKPLLARRGLWLAVGVILLIALLVGLLVAWITQRDAAQQEQLEQRLRTTMTAYQGELEPILASVGEPVPPSGFAAFPDLASTVSSLEGESPQSPVDPKAVAATVSQTIDSAKSAIDALEAFDVPALIRDKGFSEEFVLYAIGAKDDLIRAMRLYRQAAELVALAARAEGAARASLLASAKGVLEVADETLAQGYSDYVQAQTKAGVFEPSLLPGLTGAG
jgi:hypothetical protein